MIALLRPRLKTGRIDAPERLRSRLDSFRYLFPLRQQLPQRALARIEQLANALRFLDADEVRQRRFVLGDLRFGARGQGFDLWKNGPGRGGISALRMRAPGTLQRKAVLWKR